MSEIEKYYNGEIIVDFEEETELEKEYNKVAELYSKAVKKKIEYHKEIERLKNIIKEVREYIENNWISQKDADNYRFDDEELNIEISDIAVLFDILDKGE